MNEQNESKASQAAERLSEGISNLVKQITGTARSDAVFGEPREVAGRTVIPVAEVACGMGWGMGFGEGSSTSEKSGEGPNSGSGGGGGGGGGAKARPVAVIVIGPDGVEIQPVFDRTKIYLAAAMTAAFSLLWLMRLRRMDKAGQMMLAGKAISPRRMGNLVGL
jgi:uncharacterized spore protein YtfJ